MRLGQVTSELLGGFQCLWTKLGGLHLSSAGSSSGSSRNRCCCRTQQWFCSHQRAHHPSPSGPPRLCFALLFARLFPLPCASFPVTAAPTARQYLEDLRAAAGGGAGDEDGDEGIGGDFRTGAAVDGEVDEKLRLDALEVSVARDTCRPTKDTCRGAAGAEASLCQQHKRRCAPPSLDRLPNTTHPTPFRTPPPHIYPPAHVRTATNVSTHSQSSGRLQRKLAHRVQVPQQPDAADAGADAGSASSSRYGSGRFCRAHRLSPTAVALSADECSAFTVSKDGSILRWDLETMKRTQLVRCGCVCLLRRGEVFAVGSCDKGRCWCRACCPVKVDCWMAVVC